MKEKTKEKRKGTLNVQNALSKLCHAQVCTKNEKKRRCKWIYSGLAYKMVQ